RSLSFSFSAASFPLAARGMIEKETERVLAEQKRRLVRISGDARDLGRPDASRMAETCRRFFLHAPLGEAAIFRAFDSRRQVRRLAWALPYRLGEEPSIAESPHLALALSLIERHWRNRLIAPLRFALLRYWRSLPRENGARLRALLHARGRRKLGERIVFFTAEAGPELAARFLLEKEVPLDRGMEYLDISDSLRDSEYFQHFLFAYTERAMKGKNPLRHAGEILDFLEGVKKREVVRRGIAPLVVGCEALPPLAPLKGRIERLFRSEIGDPIDPVACRPWPDATPAERKRWEEACRIVKGWITQNFIERFFDKIVVDADRKAFWLRYIDAIERFKLYVNEGERYHLQHDPTLAPYFESRVGRLAGRQQNAILIQIDDYLFVEFAKTGDACYVY
ncbi:MAG: hypothetical protein D6795_04810, partial [Deltaproteobacteria bacterium]